MFSGGDQCCIPQLKQGNGIVWLPQFLPPLFSRHTFPAILHLLSTKQIEMMTESLKQGKVIAQLNRNKGKKKRKEKKRKEITNCLFVSILCLRFTSGIDCVASHSRCQRTEIPPRRLEIIPWNCV